MRNIVIIQARENSNRFPKKVLRKIGVFTVLEHVYYRALKIKGVQKVVIATTENSKNIQKLCKDNGIEFTVGSEIDVLERYYQTATLYDADNIIRITSDCPLFDHKLATKMLKVHMKEMRDFISNVFPERSYPRGLDCEIFTMKALEVTYNEAICTYDLEHVTPFMKKYFGVELVSNSDYMSCNYNLSDLRWTVDYPNDLRNIKKIFTKYAKRKCKLNKNIKLINKLSDIELAFMNADLKQILKYAH
jgi:spore coat polysaccharide biosynthesis protein SpsF (cytidylyltransferase family)